MPYGLYEFGITQLDKIVHGPVRLGVGIAQAHIVGRSSGANVALQLALDHPAAVRSLALLEPALPGSLHQALIDADTFFDQELPAVRAWRWPPPWPTSCST
jgi:pimeloyl-ACP methyl ester carboxylesterase